MSKKIEKIQNNFNFNNLAKIYIKYKEFSGKDDFILMKYLNNVFGII